MDINMQMSLELQIIRKVGKNIGNIGKLGIGLKKMQMVE